MGKQLALFMLLAQAHVLLAQAHGSEKTAGGHRKKEKKSRESFRKFNQWHCLLVEHATLPHDLGCGTETPIRHAQKLVPVYLCMCVCTCKHEKQPSVSGLKTKKRKPGGGGCPPAYPPACFLRCQTTQATRQARAPAWRPLRGHVLTTYHHGYSGTTCGTTAVGEQQNLHVALPSGSEQKQSPSFPSLSGHTHSRNPATTSETKTKRTLGKHNRDRREPSLKYIFFFHSCDAPVLHNLCRTSVSCSAV